MIDDAIAQRIVEFIDTQGMAPGTHLPAQRMADMLRVSRTPINDALALLHERGLVHREPRRGYFVAVPSASRSRSTATPRSTPTPPQQRRQRNRFDVGAARLSPATLYERVADDCLHARLPSSVTESLLRKTYGASAAEVHAVMARVVGEGWAEKSLGYGWIFSPVLTTPDGLWQSYRVRLALEPAALLEPTYRMAPEVIERLRRVELDLLQGGIERATPLELHERGVRFHEALVEASGNVFFIETVRRVNRLRRLLSYRSMQDRKRYPQHAKQHLKLLGLLEREHNDEAAAMMRHHLQHTLRNMGKIEGLLLNPKRDTR